jgi:eukaryotic-like serine/threonine-protein kinase
MPIAAGARLGAYEILTLIGSGGMGEVYRARDTKLSRDVALKVLPSEFTSDPERLARFKREAQVLASLDHPNIGAIYGFEDSEGVHALVRFASNRGNNSSPSPFGSYWDYEPFSSHNPSALR